MFVYKVKIESINSILEVIFTPECNKNIHISKVFLETVLTIILIKLDLTQHLKFTKIVILKHLDSGLWNMKNYMTNISRMNFNILLTHRCNFFSPIFGTLSDLDFFGNGGIGAKKYLKHINFLKFLP